MDGAGFMQGMSARRSRSDRRKSSRFAGCLVWGVVGSLVCLLAGVFGFYWWIGSYLHSDGFRILLQGQLARFTGSEVTLAPLSWERMGVATDEIRATEGPAFSSLEMRDTRARVSLDGWGRGVWVIEGARAEGLTLDLKNRAPAAAVPEMAVPAPAAVGFLFFKLPTRVEVPAFEVARMNLRFGEDTDFRILGSQAVVKKISGDQFELALRGGTFRMAPFPGVGGSGREFQIRDAKARISDGGIFVTEAVGTDASGARVNVSGTQPFADKSVPVRWQTRVEDLPVGEVVGAEWSSRIFGRLGIEMESTGSAPGVMRHRGSVVVTDARFTSPPPPPRDGWVARVEDGLIGVAGVVMPVLGAYTDRTMQFRNLVFDRAVFDFEIEGERVRLSNIDLRSGGFFGVQGELAMEGGRLEGTLQVGVSRSVLLGIPGAETVVFTENRDGLVWTPVRISGTLENPQEDLTARMMAAASSRIQEVLPGVNEVIDVIDGGVLPGMREVINQGVDLIDQGARVIDALPIPVPLPLPGGGR